MREVERCYDFVKMLLVLWTWNPLRYTGGCIYSSVLFGHP